MRSKIGRGVDFLRAPRTIPQKGRYGGGVDAREERLARNEVVFRDVNERIDQLAIAPADPAVETYEFFCECSNLDCTLLLSVTLETYERVRADATQFLVAPGHELPEIEEIVERADAYQVVKKDGEAAEIAREEDPRAQPPGAGG